MNKNHRVEKEIRDDDSIIEQVEQNEKPDPNQMDIEIKTTLIDEPSLKSNLMKTEVDTNKKGPKSNFSQIQTETCSS